LNLTQFKLFSLYVLFFWKEQVPNEQSTAVLVDFIETNIAKESTVEKVLEKIADLVKANEPFLIDEERNQCFLTKLMKTYPKKYNIQMQVLKIVEYSLRSYTQAYLNYNEENTDINFPFYDMAFIQRLYYAFSVNKVWVELIRGFVGNNFLFFLKEIWRLKRNSTMLQSHFGRFFLFQWDIY